MVAGNFSRLGVWGRWMLATVLGFIVAGVVGTGVGFISVPIVGILIAFLPLPGAQGQGAIGYILIGCAIAGAVVGGAAIGKSQWFILQRWFERSLWWILASAAGWTGIIVAATILAYTHVAGPVGQPDGTFVQTTLWDNAGAIASSVTGMLIAALVMGVLQSLALRFTLLQAAWWIATNILAFLIAAAIMILWVQGAGGMFGIPVFFAAYSPFYAAISGFTMIHLLSARFAANS
jgi:hypothetical protein